MTNTPERIHVDHSAINRLGHWTTATDLRNTRRTGTYPTVDDPARTQA